MPEGISRLPRLELLLLSNNHIQKMPDGIAQLKTLRTLMLTGNTIPMAEREGIVAALAHCKVYF